MKLLTIGEKVIMIRNFSHLSTVLLILAILITPAIPMFNSAQDSIEIGQMENNAVEGEPSPQVESLHPATQVSESQSAPASEAGSIEEAYFDFLKALNSEQQKKSGKLLGRLVRSSRDLSSYKIDEYKSYLNIYFPDAHSDYVQSYMIESYIGQKKWDEVQVGLLKFVCLYPDSPLRGPVIENSSQFVQKEDYYQSNRDKLLSMLQESLESEEIHDSYAEFLSTVHSLNDSRLSSIFIREAWEFLALYSDLPHASAVLMWLAEEELVSNAHHTALMIYEKLMSLYPTSPDLAAALYQTGTLQQEQFGEFEAAVTTFRQFLQQFPEDSLVSNAQYRIATIADKNFKDWANAIEEYEKLVTQYSSSIHAIPSLLRIGEIQAGKLKQREEAITTYNRVASEYPDSTAQATEALQRAGELYEKSKEYAKAVDQYMVIHDKYPGTDGALSGLEKCAVIYEKKLKMRDKAVDVLSLIVDEFPDTKNAAKAEKRLQKLNK